MEAVGLRMESTVRLSMIKELARALLDEVEDLAKAQDSESKLHEEAGFYEMVKAYEILLIRRALLKTDWHQRRAAQLLHLKPTTLHNLIKVYGISKHRKAPEYRSGEIIANIPEPLAQTNETR
jgi:transcriptional regulator with GAF, ATPase, and Fis domain